MYADSFICEPHTLVSTEESPREQAWSSNTLDIVTKRTEADRASVSSGGPRLHFDWLPLSRRVEPSTTRYSTARRQSVCMNDNLFGMGCRPRRKGRAARLAIIWLFWSACRLRKPRNHFNSVVRGELHGGHVDVRSTVVVMNEEFIVSRFESWSKTDEFLDEWKSYLRKKWYFKLF